jgi:hypothetical protein
MKMKMKKTNKKNNKKTKIKKRQIAGAHGQYQRDITSDTFLGIYFNSKRMEGKPDQFAKVRTYPLDAAYLQFLCNTKSIRFENNMVNIENNNPNLIISINEIIDNKASGMPSKKNNSNNKWSKVSSKNKKKQTEKSKFKSRQQSSKPKPSIIDLPTENKFKKVYESPEIKETTFIKGQNIYVPVRTMEYDIPSYIINNITYELELLDYINKKIDHFMDFEDPRFKIEYDFNDKIKIIGILDHKHMGHFFGNKPLMKEYFENISEFQKRNYHDEIIKMYNQTTSKEEAKIKNSKTDLYKITNELENIESHFNYFLHNDKAKKDELVSKYRDKLNEILNDTNPFSRPNLKIRYRFFILQKKGASSEYNFMVKNIREVGPEHTDILKKLLELIQTEIPKKFNLLQPEDEGVYKNFYSSCEYGTLFNIEVEYFHPFHKLYFFSYVYQKRMLLEELIFASTRIINHEPLLRQIKLEYDNKKYKIKNADDLKSELMLNTSVSDDEEEEQNNSNNNMLNGGAIFDVDLISSPVKIIICNHLITFDFEIYYEKGGNYYYLLLESKLSQLYKKAQRSLRDILIQLLNPKISNNSWNKIHSYKNGSINTFLLNYGSCFIVKNHKLLDTDDNIFKKVVSIPFLRHDKIYDYPFIESYPKAPSAILKYIKKIIAESNLNNSNNIDIKQEIDTQEYGPIQVVVIKIGNFVCFTKKDPEYNTVWIFNLSEDKPRLKNFMDLTDKQLFPKLKLLLQKHKVYDPKTQLLCVNNISVPHLNSLHIKIYKFNNYDSMSYKEEISQNSELRIVQVDRIINFMNIDNNYYNEYKRSENYVVYSNYVYAIILIPPPTI